MPATKNTWRAPKIMALNSHPHSVLALLYQGKYGTHLPIDAAYFECKERNASWGRHGLLNAATKFKEASNWQSVMDAL